MDPRLVLMLPGADVKVDTASVVMDAACDGEVVEEEDEEDEEEVSPAVTAWSESVELVSGLFLRPACCCCWSSVVVPTGADSGFPK